MGCPVVTEPPPSLPVCRAHASEVLWEIMGMGAGSELTLRLCGGQRSDAAIKVLTWSLL